MIVLSKIVQPNGDMIVEFYDSESGKSWTEVIKEGAC
jgi:hypothetical protein